MKTSNIMMIMMIFLLGIMTINTANAVLTDNLVAGWEFDETTGTTAYDVLSLYNGTYYAGQTLDNAPVATNLLKSVNMTTHYSYVEMASNIFNDVATNNAFTYNTWLKPESIIANPASMDLMFKQFDGTNGIEFGFLELSNTSIGFFVYAGNTTNFVINTGEVQGCTMEASEYLQVPRMVTVQFDGNTLYVYYNNVICGTVSGQLQIENSHPYPFRIGRTDGQGFQGMIDSTMLWSRNLTGTEMTTLYNSGSGIPYPFGEEPPCVESWTSNNTACNGFNYTIQYYDSNNCGTYDNLPVNNGSVINCEPTSITGAVTQVNNSIVSILVALIILAVIIGIIGLLLNHLGMMSKNVMMIMGAVLVALVLIILVLSFKMIGVV